HGEPAGVLVGRKEHVRVLVRVARAKDVLPRAGHLLEAYDRGVLGADRVDRRPIARSVPMDVERLHGEVDGTWIGVAGSEGIVRGAGGEEEGEARELRRHVGGKHRGPPDARQAPGPRGASKKRGRKADPVVTTTTRKGRGRDFADVAYAMSTSHPSLPDRK